MENHEFFLSILNLPTFLKGHFYLWFLSASLRIFMVKILFFFFSVLFIYLFIYFTILYWFCHTLTWIHHRCMYVSHPELPSHLLSHPIPVGHPSVPAGAPYLMHQTWTGDSFHMWSYTYLNVILQNHPTLALSRRVQNTVLYICVSFAVLHIGSSLPSF